MYVRQVIGSLLASGAVGYLGLSSGFGVIEAVALAGIGYIVARLIFATIGRTRALLPRGTRGRYYERCPNCNRDRYRMGGDWILTCHGCGWKSGVAVFRWFTRSVPAIQFRYSVSRLHILAIILFGAILVVPKPTSTGVSVPQIMFSVPTISIPTPTWQQSLFAVLALAFVILALLWPSPERELYCKFCGQYLDAENPPEACPKCGSNRFTTEDPGVGERRRHEFEG